MNGATKRRSWLLMLTLCGTGIWPVAPLRAEIQKVFHIHNPWTDTPNQEINDMHVTFKNTVYNGTLGVLPNPHGLGARREYPSNRFDGSTGQGTKKIKFSAGSMQFCETDTFFIRLRGKSKDPVAKKLITKVEFSHDGTVITAKTLKQTTQADRRRFNQNVTGFTNDEEFDFEDISDAYLRIRNTEASLNLRYTFTNSQVTKDIPCSEFESEDWATPSGGTVVYGPTYVTIEPGETFELPLGAVDPSTYALATVDDVTVTDLDTMEEMSYPVPQGFGESVTDPGPCVLVEEWPTVSEWGLVMLGLLLVTGGTIVLIRRRRDVALGTE